MVLCSQLIEINIHQDVAQHREIVIEQRWLGKTHRCGEPTEELGFDTDSPSGSIAGSFSRDKDAPTMA